MDAEGSRAFFVERDLLPGTLAVRLRQGPTGPGIPVLTSLDQCSQLVTQHGLGTAWSLVATHYGITGFSAEHSKQYEPPYFSLHLEAFFLYGKRLYCDKRNLPPRKHIIFLSCTPLLPDQPPIFYKNFPMLLLNQHHTATWLVFLQMCSLGLTSFLLVSTLRLLSLKDGMVCSVA